jgi:hypothetical protein
MQQILSRAHSYIQKLLSRQGANNLESYPGDTLFHSPARMQISLFGCHLDWKENS